MITGGTPGPPRFPHPLRRCPQTDRNDGGGVYVVVVGGGDRRAEVWILAQAGTRR